MHHKFELSSIIRSVLSFPRVPYYSYKPLDGGGSTDAFRLLVLQPSSILSSPISSQLIESSWGQEKAAIQKQRGFVALSYTWGSQVQKTLIDVDGRRFEVTKNLDLALRSLRQPRIPLRLWAEWINQTDVDERNSHVAQMRSIYSAAKETTIFLGEATEGSNELFSTIESASSSVLQAATRSAVIKSLLDASSLKKSELVEEAINILQRPYWTRIWVFQEIVVSHNPWIQCGKVKVSWESFCQALIALLDFNGKQGSGSGYSYGLRSRLEDVYWERRAYRHAQGISQRAPRWDMSTSHEFEGRMKLLDLLVTKRGSKATDTRDMVFAVSGVATKPKAWNPMSITYEKSPSFVFMSVVTYLLDHDQSYEVLSHAGQHPPITSKDKMKIPSWMPDWRIQSDYKHKIIDQLGIPPGSKDLVTKNHVCLEDHGILACVGYLYDTVHITSSSAQEASPSSGHGLWDTKWQRRKMLEHGILSDPSTKLGTVNDLFRRSHPLINNRKLAKTKGGILCLVPRDTKEGDLICQFVGSPVPFILRKLEERELRVEAVAVWRRVLDKLLDWITWTRNLKVNYEDADSEIREGLRAKLGKKRLAEDGFDVEITMRIEHCGFVGEGFVDGLMMGTGNSIVGGERGRRSSLPFGKSVLIEGLCCWNIFYNDVLTPGYSRYLGYLGCGYHVALLVYVFT